MCRFPGPASGDTGYAGNDDPTGAGVIAPEASSSGLLREIDRCRRELADSIRRVLDTPELREPKLQRLTARSGDPTLRVEERYLHSSVAPRTEAKRISVQALARNPDAVVILGIGLGYHIQALRELNPTVPLYVVEPSPTLLREALDVLPAEWWCRYGPDLFFPPKGTDALVAELNRRGINRPALLTLQGPSRLYLDHEESLRTTLEQYGERRSVNRNTLRRFGKLWVRNTIRNLPRSGSLADISRLPRIPDHVPALVCGAGPTLDEVVPYLPELRHRCVLIAVDTAVGVLQRAGVPPHLAVVADPQYWNTRHLDALRFEHPPGEPQTILVAESATHPRVFRLWRGPALLFASLFPLGTFIDRRMGRKKKLGAGGSVATSAWDLARILGARTIYLAGVDLGFPGNRTHCAGSFFEERMIMNAHRLSPAEGSHFRYLHDAQPQPVAAAGGGTVLSDRRMQVYRSWFSEQQRNHPDRETHLLSSSSSAIEGFHVTDPRELIAALPPEGAWVPAIGAASDRQERPSVRSMRQELRASLENMAGIARKGLDICSQLDSRAELSPVDLTPADLGRLDDLDQELKLQNDRELAGFLAREALEGITAMKVATVRDAIEQARRLYRALEDSCRYHQELLERYE
ncbi:MAG: DUF115 domain-containing protein [Spirochaetaceae bacterium]|nr:MAG: DUF115 domain-containing protein [Spirochaetaceae bacterium]